MTADETLRDQALDWAVRVGDPDFTDWDGFTQWLEHNPAHAAAYDAITAQVEDAARLLEQAGPANDAAGQDEISADDLLAPDLHAPPPATNRRAFMGGAIAASLALVAGLWMWRTDERALYAVNTPPGQMQTIALEQGTSVTIEGGTHIVLDRNDPRFARLDNGQALFTVRHDEDRPFVVEAGEDTLVDLGTVFNVRHDSDRLSVAVSEGAVHFNPDEQDVRIAPGERLIQTDKRTYRLEPVAIAQVGEWRQGRLTFIDAPLAVVAADLSRATGLKYRVAAGRGSQLVSGSIMTAPLRDDPRAIAPLLNVDIRADGEGWVIGAP